MNTYKTEEKLLQSIENKVNSIKNKMSYQGCNKEKPASHGRCNRRFDGPTSGFGEGCSRMGGRSSFEHGPPPYHHGFRGHHHNHHGMEERSPFFNHSHNHHGGQETSCRPNIGHGHGHGHKHGHGHEHGHSHGHGNIGHHHFGRGHGGHHGQHGPHHQMTHGNHFHFGPHGHHHFGRRHHEEIECRFPIQRRHSADTANIERHQCKH